MADNPEFLGNPKQPPQRGGKKCFCRYPLIKPKDVGTHVAFCKCAMDEVNETVTFIPPTPVPLVAVINADGSITTTHADETVLQTLGDGTNTSFIEKATTFAKENKGLLIAAVVLYFLAKDK